VCNLAIQATETNKCDLSSFEFESVAQISLPVVSCYIPSEISVSKIYSFWNFSIGYGSFL